jgi:hypothetical protein
VTEETERFVVSLQENLRVAFLNRRATQLTVRCFNCGDSLDLDHGHCNIKLNDVDGFLVFRCVKCGFSGAVTPEFVRNLEVYELDALQIAHKNISKVKSSKRFKSASKKIKRLKIPLPKNKSDYRRLEYLEDRLNIELSESEIQRLRIITDFREFFRINPFLDFTEENDIMAMLSDEGLGFLSADSSTISFRDTSDNWKTRYFVYKIVDNDLIATSNIYSIKKEIDLLTKSPNVIITEGIIDLLGVYYSGLLSEDEKFDDETILLTAGSKTFFAVFNKILSYGFMECNAHFFADKDVNLNYFKRIKSNNLLLQNKQVKVSYNEFPKEKDFGVESSRIQQKLFNI